MHGFPQLAVRDARTRGYSVKALETARRMLVQAYYGAMFVRTVEDKKNITETVSDTLDLGSGEVEWTVYVFDVKDDAKGAQLMQSRNGNTGIVMDLSHSEFRNLWMQSRH